MTTKMISFDDRALPDIRKFLLDTLAEARMPPRIPPNPAGSPCHFEALAVPEIHAWAGRPNRKDWCKL
jgi:hypothetical protein